jgi:hypothetical protein
VVSSREERRRRREAGLPEQSRGERLQGWFSGFGEWAARPTSLVALFVVLLVIVGGVVFLVVGGSDSGSGGHNAKQAAAKIKPGEIEVTVLNGTAVPGLAATFADKVEGKGFQRGAVTNSSSSFATSVVMFKRGHKPEAQKVAKQLKISKLQPMTGEIESASAGAAVAVIVGEDNAEAVE